MSVQKALRGVWEPTARHIRAEFNGEIVADSYNAMLLRESGYQIYYFFPINDVRMDLLEASEYTTEAHVKGKTKHWDIRVGDRVAEHAAFTYSSQVDDRPDFTGYIAFEWNAIDHWYEEAEEVLVHPRDPYHRVDTIKSARHIKVVVDGTVIAETRQPYLLFETSLPTRYYIPMEDVNFEYLEPTDHHTGCPYKGEASYWNVVVNGNVHNNVVWAYLDPLPEIPKIKDTVAFYNERVDIYVDGELEERPRTVFA